MVMYIIASKVNSTFGTTGNATAEKMTAKVVGRNSELSLWREELRLNLTTWSCSEARLRNFEHFLLLNRFHRLDFPASRGSFPGVR